MLAMDLVIHANERFLEELRDLKVRILLRLTEQGTYCLLMHVVCVDHVTQTHQDLTVTITHLTKLP